MRDDRVGGSGFGTPSDPGALDVEIPSPRRAPGGSHRRARKKPKSRKRRILKWTSIVTAVTVLGTAGSAFGYYEFLAGKIRKGERSSGTTNVAKTKANAEGQTAMNILILGSDTSGSSADVALGGAGDSSGARADVIMIAHLSADRSNMSV